MTVNVGVSGVRVIGKNHIRWLTTVLARSAIIAAVRGEVIAEDTAALGESSAVNVRRNKKDSGRMPENFGQHPAAEIYLSQPGLGVVLAARVLGELGDDHGRFITARSRKNDSGQSPITPAPGKKTMVLARFATNRRLGDALYGSSQMRAWSCRRIVAGIGVEVF